MLNLPIEPILRHYGAEIPGGRGWQDIVCPFHGESNASFGVNLEINACKCMACPAKGDTLGLIMWKENCDFKAALAFYESIAGSGHPALQRPVGGKRGDGVSHQRTRPFERNSQLFSPRVRRRPFA